jgi:shikimate kinase
MKPNNVILVGPMGAGKTTVGKALAKIASMDFVDCDLELETRTGVSVTTIFEIEGEEGFRRREAALLREISARSGTVIATGGGVVIQPENRELLRRAGIVIYLAAPVARLLRRTRNSRNRPLLDTPDPEKTLADLLETRDPLYREVADFVVRVDDRSPQSLARRIFDNIRRHENAKT